MELLNIIINHWEILVIIITTLLAWYKDTIATFLGWKKAKVETEFIAADVLEKNLEIYQEMLTDIDTRYKLKIQELELDFDKSLARLKAQLMALRTINENNQVIIKQQRALIKQHLKNLEECETQLIKHKNKNK